MPSVLTYQFRSGLRSTVTTLTKPEKYIQPLVVHVAITDALLVLHYQSVDVPFVRSCESLGLVRMILLHYLCSVGCNALRIVYVTDQQTDRLRTYYLWIWGFV